MCTSSHKEKLEILCCTYKSVRFVKIRSVALSSIYWVRRQLVIWSDSCCVTLTKIKKGDSYPDRDLHPRVHCYFGERVSEYSICIGNHFHQTQRHRIYRKWKWSMAGSLATRCHGFSTAFNWGECILRSDIEVLCYQILQAMIGFLIWLRLIECFRAITPNQTRQLDCEGNGDVPLCTVENTTLCNQQL